MEGIMKNGVFEKYGICQFMDYEESKDRCFLTFLSNGALHVAVMRKKGSQIVFYKHEKELILE